MIFDVTYYPANYHPGWSLKVKCDTLKINDILANTKKRWDALIDGENARVAEEMGDDLDDSDLYKPMPIDRKQLIITDLMGNVFKDSDVYMYNYYYPPRIGNEGGKIRMLIYEGRFFNFHELCFNHSMGYVSKMNSEGKYEYVFLYFSDEDVDDDVMLAIKREYLKKLHDQINRAGVNIAKIMNAKQPDFDSRLISQQVHEFLVGDTKRARTEEEELEQSGICLIT